MSLFRIILVTFGALLASAQNQSPPAVHYTLTRRGGPAHLNRTADLAWLKEQLVATESRFNLTRREVRGNQIVRVPKPQGQGGGNSGIKLLGEVGRSGHWFATLLLGASQQPIDMDIDMLTADFTVTSTQSPHGSKFDEFFSKSYQTSNDYHPFPNCGYPLDQTWLPQDKKSVPLYFAHCRPPKQSLATLNPSGALLGIAPSEFLRQVEGDSFMKQLLSLKVIENEVWSLTLINGFQGLLSIGGTASDQMQTIQDRIEIFLGRSGGDSLQAEQIVDPEQAKEDEANGAPEGLTTGKSQAPLKDGPASEDSKAPEDNKGAKPGGNKHAISKEQPAMGAGNLPVNDPKGVAFEAPKDAVKDPAKEPPPVAGNVPQPNIIKKRELVDLPVEGPPPKNQAPAPEFLMEPYTPLNKRALRGARVIGDHRLPSWRDQWSWSPVEGAAGWWQTLMRGVWVDNAKVLKNQPCVIDVNAPFILAPPLAAKALYGSISGSRRLPEPYSNFYAYPCNNPPNIAMEFGGWRFPVMRGMKSYDNSNGPNGKFSLGKVSDESGYCVGAVVETRIGVGDQAPLKSHHSRKEDMLRGFGTVEAGMVAGNGMREVWVLGEQMFRGLGLVFDAKQREVGFRIY